LVLDTSLVMVPVPWPVPAILAVLFTGARVKVAVIVWFCVTVKFPGEILRPAPPKVLNKLSESGVAVRVTLAPFA
jgi:hypothetical protein